MTRIEAASVRPRPFGPVAAAFVLALLTASPAVAQYAASCPPPQKLAAGACVTACPAGYEDRGPTCVYRNQSN